VTAARSRDDGQWIDRVPIALCRGNQLQGIAAMKRNAIRTVATVLAAAALALAAGSADAKGCLKGAVVGGLAGHVAGHHGVLGAVAGCLYGRHVAKQQARHPQGPAPAGQGKI
jgi:outer membrane lipoprotein SlyB